LRICDILHRGIIHPSFVLKERNDREVLCD
jgi:hypothetical protein